MSVGEGGRTTACLFRRNPGHGGGEAGDESQLHISERAPETNKAAEDVACDENLSRWPSAEGSLPTLIVSAERLQVKSESNCGQGESLSRL